jgi:hypothetical protein
MYPRDNKKICELGSPERLGYLQVIFLNGEVYKEEKLVWD